MGSLRMERVGVSSLSPSEVMLVEEGTTETKVLKEVDEKEAKDWTRPVGLEHEDSRLLLAESGNAVKQL